METTTREKAPGDVFNPLTGWEAASRWNAATFDWMARGFQQWVTLWTTLPPYPSVTAHPQAETTDTDERPVAHAEPKRAPSRTRAKAKVKSKPPTRG